MGMTENVNRMGHGTVVMRNPMGHGSQRVKSKKGTSTLNFSSKSGNVMMKCEGVANSYAKSFCPSARYQVWQ